MKTEKTILCVEDNKDTCDLLTFVFRNKGFQFTACDTAEEAVRNARTNNYAAIITDFHLKGMDGVDLCRAVRTFNQATPIIFFSGETRPEKKQAAIEAGAQAYINKPADFETVAQTVIQLINNGVNNK